MSKAGLMRPTAGAAGAKRGSNALAMKVFWAVLIAIVTALFYYQAYSHTRIMSRNRKFSSALEGAFKATELESTPDSAGVIPNTGSSVFGQLVDRCHVEEGAEYPGNLIRWADDAHMAKTVGECCEQCLVTNGCNTWVWCGKKDGCLGDHKFGECWLKKAEVADLLRDHVGQGDPKNVLWTSGLLYTVNEKLASEKAVREREEAEAKRRKELRENPELPLVYMDVTIDGELEGRIEAVLFTKESPLAAENMRQFCTGEMGPPHVLKGAYFYRIIDKFIDQTGVETTSIYGGQFDDDPGGLELKHDRPYLLSTANSGHNTNTAHFSIMVAPAPHLNGNYVIFGECVSGFDVIKKVNALAFDMPKKELLHSDRARISDTGQLRRGTYRSDVDRAIEAAKQAELLSKRKSAASVAAGTRTAA